MASFREAVKTSLQKFLCSAMESDDRSREWLKRATRGIPGAPGFFENKDTYWDGVRSMVCPVPTPGGNAAYPPATGEQGKCDGVLYDCTFSYTREDGVEGTQGPIRRYGPIGPLVSSNDNRAWCFFNRSDAGFGSNPPSSYACRNIFSTSTGLRRLNYQFTSIVRVDGAPDNCGAPGKQDPPEGDDNITYDGPDGNPINVDISFNPTIPIVLPGGELHMPIDVCVGVFCIDVDFNVSTGDINFNFGGKPGSSGCCPPREDDEQDDNDDDPPPPENEDRYVGIVVNSAIGGNGPYPATQIGDGVGPDLFIPRIGQVRFMIADGGRRTYTIDQPIKQLSQVVYVPGDAVAYDWTILMDGDWTATATGIPVKK